MIIIEVISSLLHHNLVQLIYIPIIVWIVIVILFLGILSKRYTFGKWTTENPNPYCNETLGMPRGVMRGILTLSLLFTLLLLEIFAIENPTFEANINQFIVAFQMMLAFYFGSQVMHHLTSSEQAKTKHITDTIAKVEETKAAVMSAPTTTNTSVTVVEEKGATELAEEDFSDEDAVG
jgi:hypothetical protein